MKATILITGASRGIGRCLCGYFAGRGGTVIAAARNPDDVGKEFRRVALDLREPDSIARLAARLRDEMPRLDILINNAADTTSKPLLETSLEEIDNLVRTNVTGFLQLCREIGAWMAIAGGGTIVNISSLAGYKPNPAQTVYSVTKSAVNGASDAIRAELAGKNIHVLNVALPSIAVEEPRRPGQAPVGKFARALERAIERKQTELFLSPVTKWLMRLYRFYPPLSRLRG